MGRVARDAAALTLALSLLAPACALAHKGQQGTSTPGAAVNSTAPAAGTSTRSGTSQGRNGALGSQTGATRTGASGATTGGAAAGVGGASPAGATSTPATGATGTTPATGSVPAAASTQPAVTTPTSTVPPAPAKKKSGGRHISTGAAIVAVLAALLVLGAAAWALARRFAYEPTWWLGMRHSFSEASFRTSATWAELRDWARIGR